MKTALARFGAAVLALPRERMALVLAVSLVLGVFPIYGCPTVLCLLAALLLRLNVPAMQAINQLTSPLQLALMVPLNRLGARLMGALTVSTLPRMPGIAGAARDAVLGWLCLCVPLGLVVYLLLAYFLRQPTPALALRTVD